MCNRCDQIEQTAIPVVPIDVAVFKAFSSSTGIDSVVIARADLEWLLRWARQ